MFLYARPVFLFLIVLASANIAFAAGQEGPPDELESSLEFEEPDAQEGEYQDPDEGEYQDSDEGEYQDSDEGEYQDSDEGEYQDSDEGEYEDSDEGADEDSTDEGVKEANAKKVDKMMPALIAGGAVCAGGGCLGLTALGCGTWAALCGGPVVLGVAAGGGGLTGALIEDVPLGDSILAISLATGGTIASSLVMGLTAVAAATAFVMIVAPDQNTNLIVDRVIAIGAISVASIMAAGITAGSMFMLLPDDVGNKGNDSKDAQVVHKELPAKLPSSMNLQAKLPANELQMAF